MIKIKPLDVHSRLSELGVRKEILVLAAQSGFIERANATPFDPTTSPGTDAWRYTVRLLRQQLEADGWRLDDVRNLPLIISDLHKVNLTVSSGNDFTGLEQSPPNEPKSKNPKGALFDAAIERNVRQPDLFPSLLPEAKRRFADTLSYPTWVFLIRITDDSIRAELSLPSSMDEQTDQIDGWSERIIIDVPLPGGDLSEAPEADIGPDILPLVSPKI